MRQDRGWLDHAARLRAGAVTMASLHQGQQPIPARAGVGLRAPHYQEILEQLPPIPWLEVHSENFFGEGGSALAQLDQVRSHYPISLHGVGLSLGTSGPLRQRHLEDLRRFVKRVEPVLVSEHLSWSAAGGRFLNDLLPLPYTEEALDVVVAHIAETQEALGRQILIENVSSYLQFSQSQLDEWEFLSLAAQRSGCGILLDVNNVHVNASNHGFSAEHFIRAIPPSLVQEVHLAGFTTRHIGAKAMLIDTHNRPVSDAVWHLYRLAMAHLGPRPTLIEWDADIPPLQVLLQEAAAANAIMDEKHAQVG